MPSTRGAAESSPNASGAMCRDVTARKERGALGAATANTLVKTWFPKPVVSIHSASRTIIYTWLNDDNTLRKAGSQNDPYAVFHRMLERGAPPSDWVALMRACEPMTAEANEGDASDVIER